MATIKSLAAKKPTSVFLRKVKLDLKPVFKGVTKAVTHFATGKFEELGNDIAETLAGLGLNAPPEELAYLLIKRSLFNAASDLAQESISHFQLDEITELSEFNSTFELKLANIEISLDKSFLERPSKLKFLTDIVPLYSLWLTSMGVTSHSADVIAKRLPSYFVYALTDEWRKNASSYKPLLDLLQTPFSKAEERERDWENYHAMLMRRTQENVFDEAFSLSQIYVPLRAYYQETSASRLSGSDRFAQNKTKNIEDLESELTSWLKKNDKNDAVRVISGGPGSGKSSFTKIFCASVSEKKIAKPIYIPLHLIDPTREVADEIAKFVMDEGFLRFNPLEQDHQESNLLFVFDGLDELASQGKVAAQVAKNFVQAVERMVERRNLGQFPLFVLISGRELVIQENETEFRRPRQVLTILPYFIPKHEHGEYNDPKKLLAIDARNTWWTNYGVLTGQKFNGLPKNLRRSEIDEITSQPLLNYLVALSFSRGKLNFDEALNLNKIYADLVAAVYERGYEKRTFKPISHISAKDFERILEEIGLAAWHASDGRSTSINEILEHCKESGLEALVATFQEGAKAGVTKLLAAFFFRKSGEHSSGDATFVFTHKSFGEYLTSARIVRGIERIVTQLERRKKNLDDGFDIAEGLLQWVKLVGPAQMTPYIYRFLAQEIAQRDRSCIKNWKVHLTEMLTRTIERGMPMEKVGALSFFEAARQHNNACETLVIAVNSCAVALQENIKLDLSLASSFGTFLKRICPQREGPSSPLLYAALSYFDFSKQCFDMADLYGANLSNTIWNLSTLHFANLGSSNLREANFTDAKMDWINLDRANLSGIIMKNVRCTEAILDHAEFLSANLTDADFSRSVFTEAKFHANTKLINTNFFGVDLAKIKKNSKADFSKIVLEDRQAISKRTHASKTKKVVSTSQPEDTAN